MKWINHSASRTDLRNAKTRLVRSTTPAIVVAALALSSCGGSDDGSAPSPPAAPVSVPYTYGVTTAANPVAYWNKIASDTINLPVPRLARRRNSVRFSRSTSPPCT